MPWHPEMQQLENRLNDRLDETSDLFRKRQIVIYIVVVIMFIVVTAVATYLFDQRETSRKAFQDQITGVCYTTKQNTEHLNSAVDQLIVSAQTSRVLTAKEKEARVAFYSQIKGTVPTCPPAKR